MTWSHVVCWLGATGDWRVTYRSLIMPSTALLDTMRALRCASRYAEPGLGVNQSSSRRHAARTAAPLRCSRQGVAKEVREALRALEAEAKAEC